MLKKVNLDFNNTNFYVDRFAANDIGILDSLNTLLKYDLIRLIDMRLDKIGYGPMSLRRASSGEQCMLLIMLGIAGNIQDNSLIFISISVKIKVNNIVEKSIELFCEVILFFNIYL